MRQRILFYFFMNYFFVVHQANTRNANLSLHETKLMFFLLLISVFFYDEFLKYENLY